MKTEYDFKGALPAVDDAYVNTMMTEEQYKAIQAALRLADRLQSITEDEIFEMRKDGKLEYPIPMFGIDFFFEVTAQMISEVTDRNRPHKKDDVGEKK